MTENPRTAPPLSTRTVVIGDALIDELVGPTGTTRIVGGSALNVAVGLSILGVPATLIAMIGDDPDGATIRAHLHRFGVDLLPTITATGTGVAISERIGGEPRYTFSESMLQRAIAFDPQQQLAIAEAEVVAVSGFPFDDADQVRLLGHALADSHAIVAVDPNPRRGMLRDAKAFSDALEAIGDRADLLKIGDDDTMLLHASSPAEMTPSLLERYSHVLATEGRGGASISFGDDHRWHASLARADSIVDTMGAGDSVFASIVADIGREGLGDVDWDASLKRAMGIAATTIAHPGALLRRPE